MNAAVDFSTDSATLRELTRETEKHLSEGHSEDARGLLRDFMNASGLGAFAFGDGPSVNAGLAWVYAKLAALEPKAGHEDKAVGFGQSALLLNPNDALAHAVLPEEQVLLVGHSLMRHGKPGRARRPRAIA